MLLNPATRCSICGIPNYIISTYRELGPWPPFMGRREGRGACRTLQLDHLVPGRNGGGLRPLCAACNSRRGAAEFTDHSVLLWVRRRWRDMMSLKTLWWLNDSPGLGGTLHRNDWTTRRDAQFVAGAKEVA